jgi:uncharacterized protein YndB with AHSA1/START domain
MKHTDPPIIVEQTFRTSKEALWNAITIQVEMALWFFDNIPDFAANVGFETQFPVRSNDRVFTHLWKVTEVIPGEKISYQWSYVEYPGEALVTFELLEEGNNLRLRLTNRVISNFPRDIPEFTRASGVAGWKYFIQGRLKEYLKNIN